MLQARALARMRQAPGPVPRPHPLRRLIDGRPDDPGRRIARRTTVKLVNFLAASVYVVLACVAGTVWGFGRWRATSRWLVEDREPDEAERRTARRTSGCSRRASTG